MRPTRRALWLAAVLFAAALVWPAPELWILPAALILGLFGFDVIWALRMRGLRGSRSVAPNLAVNREARVTLVLENQGVWPSRVQIIDEPPDHCIARGLPAVARIGPRERAELSYRLTPQRRGDVAFGRIVAMVASPLGLWRVRRLLGREEKIRVYPDFAVIARYLELLSSRHTNRLGIRKSHFRGEGLEFHQLREYRNGDTFRQIDWKATARRRELISREYEEERDQRVLFLIDSGRRMRTRDGSLSHFDHALNGMLLLAYVALRQGDSVGLKLFGSGRKWVPPQRGVTSVNVLLNETYDLHSGAEPADYITAAEELMSHERKRALVIMMTNLRDEDADLMPALTLLCRRHVVLLANLRERVLDEIVQHRPAGLREALRLAGTHDYLARRKENEAQYLTLAHAVLDCTPAELPVKVVNAYWQVKRSGRL